MSNNYRRQSCPSAPALAPIGPIADWLKSKNPDAPAVKREAEEDWGRNYG